MQKYLAPLIGLLAMASMPAGAAPISSATMAMNAGAPAPVIKVHGRHAVCREDDRGWHRSRPWGREHCRRHLGPAVPLGLWIWRCADGHCGYWHRHEHRWRDGWRRGNRGEHHGRHHRRDHRDRD